MRKIFFMPVFIMAAFLLSANDAPFMAGADGETVVPYNIKGVQLEKESIHIYPEKTICRFTFHNFNRKDVKFQSGFPFDIEDEEESEPDDKIDFRIKDLNFSVTQAGIKLDSRPRKGEGYDLVFLWDQEMKAGSTVEITCEYNTLWNCQYRNDRATHGKMGYVNTRYIRETAKYWDGVVMEAHFYIHVDGLEKVRAYAYGRKEGDVPDMNIKEGDPGVKRLAGMEIEPGGYFFNAQNKAVEWHEYRVKEMKNISFSLTNRDLPYSVKDYYGLLRDFLNATFNADYEIVIKNELQEKLDIDKLKSFFETFRNRISRDHFDSWGNPAFEFGPWHNRVLFRMARNYYFARHGKVFDDPFLNEFYRDIVKPGDVVKGDLSPVEKENVDLLQKSEDEELAKEGI